MCLAVSQSCGSRGLVNSLENPKRARNPSPEKTPTVSGAGDISMAVRELVSPCAPSRNADLTTRCSHMTTVSVLQLRPSPSAWRHGDAGVTRSTRTSRRVSARATGSAPRASSEGSGPARSLRGHCPGHPPAPHCAPISPSLLDPRHQQSDQSSLSPLNQKSKRGTELSTPTRPNPPPTLPNGRTPESNAPAASLTVQTALPPTQRPLRTRFSQQGVPPARPCPERLLLLVPRPGPLQRFLLASCTGQHRAARGWHLSPPRSGRQAQSVTPRAGD